MIWGLVTLKKAYDYATTDQEKEGRDRGITSAANIYKPVWEELESKNKKIIKALDAENKFFNEQLESLKKQGNEIEQKTDELNKAIKQQFDMVNDRLQAIFEEQVELLKRQSTEHEAKAAEFIEKIRRSNDEKKIRILDEFLSSVNKNGMFSGVVEFIAICGLAYAAFNFIWLINDPIGYYLDKKMEDKREKFYNEEFEKQTRMWQKKIKGVRKEYEEQLKKLIYFQDSNNEQIKYFTEMLDDALNEYCETFAKYNVLNGMVNNDGTI